MARREDSGWRDADLTGWHTGHGFPIPAAGMGMPMIEYDRGRAVGLVNYIRRGDTLPTGPEVAQMYRAFAGVNDSEDKARLPFLTAIYDPRNWAMKLFPHNEAAAALVGAQPGWTGRPLSGGHPGWHPVTELGFAVVLYGMRKRDVPDMFAFGVEWNDQPWMDEEPVGNRGGLPFPLADISARRREYEPNISAPMRLKVPCMDVDLAVADDSDRLSLVVDYKRRGAVVDLKGTNASALASLVRPTGTPVAALITRYWSDGAEWWFEAHAVNRSGVAHLTYVLADHKGPMDGWVRMSEAQWLGVLRAARDL